jgi:diguanylate cyclase (GGDEF)-like protein
MRTRSHDDDPRDEGRLADLTSAGMWLTAGVVGTSVLALPGSSHEHLGVALLIGAFAAIWGLASLTMYLYGPTMTIGVRAVVTATMAPLVALALWASGGASSFLQPLLLFTALFVAYFFPVRLAWPLVALFAISYATPLLYDDGAIEQAYPARAVGFAFALAGATLAMQMLKRRLLVAEARQRVMAERDPLTGLYNRRSFDAALDEMVAAPDGGALVLFDFDAFKAINDEHGHPVGDAVLRAVAQGCQRAVRDRDCLARIGGDEFALIAPRAGHTGVTRIVTALEDAIADATLPDGIYTVNASFAWAVAPIDAAEAGELLECADQRLLHRKRLLKSAF